MPAMGVCGSGCTNEPYFFFFFYYLFCSLSKLPPCLFVLHNMPDEHRDHVFPELRVSKRYEHIGLIVVSHVKRIHGRLGMPCAAKGKSYGNSSGENAGTYTTAAR